MDVCGCERLPPPAVRKFRLNERLGMTELWKRAKEHAKAFSESGEDPALCDFGEREGLYYAAVKDGSGRKYIYYCKRI